MPDMTSKVAMQIYLRSKTSGAAPVITLTKDEYVWGNILKQTSTHVQVGNDLRTLTLIRFQMPSKTLDTTNSVFRYLGRDYRIDGGVQYDNPQRGQQIVPLIFTTTT